MGNKGSKYKVYDAKKVIGATQGADTQFLRLWVDSNGNYHGHPISQQEYNDYLKKVPGQQ